ncbi:MAG: glutathione peroxidase [Bacteroidetes bacterium]|nr:glutathione peroxidase [Bacteroidota bacterium]
MKTYFILFFLLAGNFLSVAQNKNIYDFTVKDIDGNDFNFGQLKGRKIMIVNTASECGFTPQYKDLEKLYRTYRDSGFVIVGFPANNFGGQEPGTDAQIKEFCTKQFNVTFPMMAKISVKGDDMHPLYRWLTDKKENGVSDADVKWNFHKFFIDEKGIWYKSVSTMTSPLNNEITEWIIK